MRTYMYIKYIHAVQNYDLRHGKHHSQFTSHLTDCNFIINQSINRVLFLTENVHSN